MRIFNEKREHGEQHERKSTLHIVSSAAAEHKEIDTFMRKLLSDLRYTVLYRIGSRGRHIGNQYKIHFRPH